MVSIASNILSSQAGKTHLFFLGQAGFIIKSKLGTVIGLDLYLSNCVERYDGFKRLMPNLLHPYEITFDYLVATHAHYDHFDVDSIPFMLSNSTTRMFASERCRAEAQRLHIADRSIDYVKVGDIREAKDIQLTFVFCDHGESAPDALGVIVQIDEWNLYFTGDTCLRLDKVDEIVADRKIDILVAPINGTFGNLSEAEAVSLCGAVKPRLIIPSHYWNFAEQHGDPGLFIKLLAEQIPTQKHLLMMAGEGVQVGQVVQNYQE